MNDEIIFEKLQQSNWASSLQIKRKNIIVIKTDKQLIPQLHKDLITMDAALIALHPKHNLEDYFLQVTAGKQHVDAFTN